MWFVFFITRQRRVVITVITNDPIPTMRRPIENAQRNPGRKILRKDIHVPTSCCSNAFGPGPGGHALAHFGHALAL
eukprot:8649818-Lingulodinium_polyedra.AAC.1